MVLVAAGAAIAVAGQASVAATAAHQRLIVGTEKGERLAGTGRPDTIRGKGGDDTLVGRARADRLYGGRGFDTIRGGRGSDFLHGGPGGGALVGGPGRDGFNMKAGRPVGGGGGEVIRARDGNADEINCGRGDDVAYVDRVEDGVYDCERVVTPDGVVVQR